MPKGASEILHCVQDDRGSRVLHLLNLYAPALLSGTLLAVCVGASLPEKAILPDIHDMYIGIERKNLYQVCYEKAAKQGGAGGTPIGAGSVPHTRFSFPSFYSVSKEKWYKKGKHTQRSAWLCGATASSPYQVWQQYTCPCVHYISYI